MLYLLHRRGLVPNGLERRVAEGFECVDRLEDEETIEPKPRVHSERLGSVLLVKGFPVG